MSSAPHRRDLLRMAVVGSAGLCLGVTWSCGASDARKTHHPEPVRAGGQVTAYVRVGEDDTVTMIVPEAEMGQGIVTALAMVLADELDVPWSQVRGVQAGADEAFGRQGTGGSTSIRRGIDSIRQAGATVRAMLVAAAANHWQVPAAECTTAEGHVVHPDTELRLSYAQIAASAAQLPVPEDAKPKPLAAYTLVGTPALRLDTPAKVTGAAMFGQDVVEPEGLVVATVARPPVTGGRIAGYDADAARAVPGVLDVIEVPTGIAVIGSHTWAAIRGREALAPRYADVPDVSTEALRRTLRARVDALAAQPADKAVASAGDAPRPGGEGLIDAIYEAPYLAHACMEPLNCTAHVDGQTVTLWVGTQSPTRARMVAAEVAGVDPAAVTVHVPWLGGGFGRRSQGDFVAEAVQVAAAAKRPVKVMWTREDDTRGGMYRPMSVQRVWGGVDASGLPDRWGHAMATVPIGPGGGQEPAELDGSSVEGLANNPYAVPHRVLFGANPVGIVSTWYWRSVGSSQNAFVVEAFFDELARLGKRDPVEARLALLEAHPKHRAVLELAASKAGWGTDLPEGRARGVALHESFGTVVAEVAEVSIDGGRPKVHKVWCALDCGRVVNPNTVEAQVHSAIAYGLSAAFHGAVHIEKGHVLPSNFHDQPIVRMGEMPEVEVHIREVSEERWGGVGEPGLPPIAPAVANAVLALTGKPLRRLPFEVV